MTERDLRHLISAEELAAQTSGIVFDCRFSLVDSRAGRREFESGHIPGARFADLEKDLSAPPGKGGRHPLPGRDAFAAWLRSQGVNSDSRIVCYDQNSGALAGRLWWLVRWLGHENVCLLDGGLDAWLGAGYAVDSEFVSPEPGDFAPTASLTRLCTAEELEGTSADLLDARDAARYRGEVEPFDPVAGHIPGAICAPFTDNLENGRFKSPEALRARFGDLGLSPPADTICYCGSGVTATHNILALLIAGFPEPILYAGSWSDWVSDPGRAVASG
jgi:thiosulfate/3-mercaptopyruvate sulfurtransferase